MKSWHINLTESIIAKSVNTTRKWCGIANAVRVNIPDSWNVRVTMETVRFNLDDDPINGEQHRGTAPATCYVYDLPARAVQWLLDANAGKPVKPIKFTLDGRTCTTAPVIRRGPARRPYRKRITPSPEVIRRCSNRRVAGLAAHSRSEPK